MISVTCRGSSDSDDEFLYIAPKNNLIDDTINFYRINLGQFIYNEWEKCTLKLPYSKRIENISFLVPHYHEPDSILVSD